MHLSPLCSSSSSSATASPDGLLGTVRDEDGSTLNHRRFAPMHEFYILFISIYTLKSKEGESRSLALYVNYQSD
jgi:hypothetical protein